MKTNLENYASEMAQLIRDAGSTESYHWSEIATVIEELVKYCDFSQQASDSLKFIGFTNGANIAMLKGSGYGAMYSDTKQECYIPLYMLKTHLHRIESTSNGSVSAESLGMDK